MNEEAPLSARVHAIEIALGEAPAPMIGRAGAGLLGAVTALAATVDAVRARVESIGAELALEREARAKRRETMLAVLKFLVPGLPALGGLVAAAIKLFHH